MPEIPKSLEPNFYNISYYFGDENDTALYRLKHSLLQLCSLPDIRPLKLRMHEFSQNSATNEEGEMGTMLEFMRIDDLGEHYLNMKLMESKCVDREDDDSECDIGDVDEGIEKIKAMEMNELMYYSEFGNRFKCLNQLNNAKRSRGSQ